MNSRFSIVEGTVFALYYITNCHVNKEFIFLKG